LEKRYSLSAQTGPGTHPSSYTRDTGSFPGVKWPRRDVNHLTLPSVKVKERVQVYFYLPLSAFMADHRVNFNITYSYFLMDAFSHSLSLSLFLRCFSNLDLSHRSALRILASWSIIIYILVSVLTTRTVGLHVQDCGLVSLPYNSW